MSLRRILQLALMVCLGALHAQIIQFESGGLKYKTMTRDGVTVMFAVLPTRIHDYAVLQVAISNGSPVSWPVKPEDFKFERPDGSVIEALSATTVIDTLMEKARGSDVIRLTAAYENALYGNTEIHSTNGYESRRQNAMAATGSNKLNAAAAASAIALVAAKLAPHQSTDGAIFYSNQGKPLGAGRLVVKIGEETFAFPVDPIGPKPR